METWANDLLKSKVHLNKRQIKLWQEGPKSLSESWVYTLLKRKYGGS